MVTEGVPISDSVSVLVTRGVQGLDFTGIISIAFVIILIAVFVWLIRSRNPRKTQFFGTHEIP